MDAEKTRMLEMVRARMRDCLNTYLEGTVAALYSGEWFPQEVRLGQTCDDRIVAEGRGYEPDSEDTGYGLRLTLTLGDETECMIEVPGYPQQIHRDLAPGVGVPTTDEALQIYLDAFGHPEVRGDE